MAIQSGNDAAIALAEHVAGSEEAFASLMNSYAAKIGMKNSHFVNAHGLTAEGHHSTAYDLALLGRAMVRDYPETYAYNKIKEFRSATSSSRTATCCCGEMAASTASRPATPPKPVTA